MPADAWRSGGLLDPRTHHRTVNAALRQVIGPCVDPLLDEPVWRQLDRRARLDGADSLATTSTTSTTSYAARSHS